MHSDAGLFQDPNLDPRLRFAQGGAWQPEVDVMSLWPKRLEKKMGFLDVRLKKSTVETFIYFIIYNII